MIMYVTTVGMIDIIIVWYTKYIINNAICNGILIHRHS